LTLRLEIDPRTRRKRLHVAYESDRDALPHEHEAEHRAILDQLLAHGVLAAGEAIEIIREIEPNSTSSSRETRSAAEQRDQVAGSN
jgi:hypothetical protein